MKRTLEKLARKRQEKEAEFSNKLKDIQAKGDVLDAIQESLKSLSPLVELEQSVSLDKATHPEEKQRSFPLTFKRPKKDSSQAMFNQQVASSLQEFRNILEQNLQQTKELCSILADMSRLYVDLIDTKDREWDALGSNHVGMIFKSMEWRVDKLKAGYQDATLLMKKFIQLKEKLNRLITVLESKDLPSPSQAKELLQPLEDFSYASFENRYRGTEEEVKKQQEGYLPCFKQDKKVLDLGCGRGEFIDLLTKEGIEVEGVDINEQMIEICRDKGYNCRRVDILETLTECEDNSLGGIFSSQVIEHLSPDYLKRMIELSYFKLASGCHIVLETLNPTSVFSLVQIYYLDISHRQPIHPQALKFLLESAGFDEVEIRYASPLEEEKLQALPASDEVNTILNRNMDKLNQLLYAPTNYAAIGKKFNKI